MTEYDSWAERVSVQLRETVRRWAVEELAPRAQDIDKSNDFPMAPIAPPFSPPLLIYRFIFHTSP